MRKKAAVIGTGIMGTGMGKTLLKEGWEISCWNRTPENAEELVKAGAELSSTPAEASSGAEYIISILWSKEALESAATGDTGLFSSAKPGQIYIDMSTQLPETAVWQAGEYEKAGADFLDSPVHGTKGEANNGGLWVMCGGKKDTFDKAEEILSIVGKTVHYMGDHGKGYAAKLCGNHLVSTIVAAICESMVMGKKAGLNPKELLNVWMDSDFRSPVVEGVGNSIITRDFDVSFHLRTMVKDTELIRNFSESIKVPVLLSNIVHEVNKIGENKGWGEENASAVVKVFEDFSGLQY